MRTREELNLEYTKLQDKIDNSSVAYLALASMVLALVGFLISALSNLGNYVFFVGIVGMFIFGWQAACMSEDMKDLKREWQLNGYGLTKYPNMSKKG